MKHKVGKREATKLEKELCEIKITLEKLNSVVDGFELFYDDVEKSKKIIDRKLWLEEVLKKGFYYISWCFILPLTEHARADVNH